MPPGMRSATLARRSATLRLRASSSSTQGPAITNSASSRNTVTSVARLRERRCRLTTLSLCLHCRGDEAGEQRVRAGRTRLEFGVELAPDEPGMVGVFDDLHEL